MIRRPALYSAVIFAGISFFATTVSVVVGTAYLVLWWVMGAIGAALFFARQRLWGETFSSGEAGLWSVFLLLVAAFVGWRFGALNQAVAFAGGTACTCAVYAAAVYRR